MVENKNASKNLVFFVDYTIGDSDNRKVEGKYTDEDSPQLYEQANYTYEIAQRLKDAGYNIYIVKVNDNISKRKG